MRKLILLILIISSALLLQSCVPAIIVAGAAAATAVSMVVYDSRSVKVMTEDSDIAYRAQTKINNNAELSNKSHISIITFNHNLLVVGQAATPELRDAAISLIHQVPKINNIYNEITIGDSINTQARSEDLWITTQAKTALLQAKNLHTSQIKVITEDGTIYLMGSVTHGQGDAAADAVKNISGVKKVVKAFEYLT